MPHRENQQFSGCLVILLIASRNPKLEGIPGSTQHTSPAALQITALATVRSHTNYCQPVSMPTLATYISLSRPTPTLPRHYPDTTQPTGSSLTARSTSGMSLAPNFNRLIIKCLYSTQLTEVEPTKFSPRNLDLRQSLVSQVCSVESWLSSEEISYAAPWGSGESYLKL